MINNGTLDISSTSNGATITNLAGNGTVNLGRQTLTLSNASGTFNGNLAGSGTLAKQGSGLLILNGNSSAFSGATQVGAGTLEVGDINTPTAVLGGTVNVGANGSCAAMARCWAMSPTVDRLRRAAPSAR